jgi:cell wall-associated NlpC family hydrolase
LDNSHDADVRGRRQAVRAQRVVARRAIGLDRANAAGMHPRTLPRVGAIAVLSSTFVAGCSQATLGVSPATIITTVIANLPRSTATEGRRTPGSTTTTTTSTSRAPTRARIPASPRATAAASRLLRTGEAYIGVPYVWGGNTPREGFDCSGFTKYIFAKQGITLPRTSREQSRVGQPVPADFRDLEPGDLMFFAEPGEAISHVAIYAGDGRILHSSSSNGGVGYTDLNTGGEWFVAYFVAARRVGL